MRQTSILEDLLDQRFIEVSARADGQLYLTAR